MKKHFKAKRKNKFNWFKIIIFILTIYISFNLFYNLIYNLYLSKLSNEKIINHIIESTKNEKKSPLLIKYQKPENILKTEFTFFENNNNNTINVDNTTSKNNLVYIYSTHETESYSDKYLEVYNINPTVKTMSYILKDYLYDLGINVLVEENSVTEILKKNNWSYKYSYDASKELVQKKINETPTLKLIIDLHRDSAPLSKTLMTYKEIPYAKILFVVGAEHENYEQNYNLAQTLNDYLNEEIPGITRGISKKSGPGVNGIYNQNLSSNSVLIELGGQYNEIEELNNSLKILSKVILKYLEGE